MRLIDKPEVFLISKPTLSWEEIYRYLFKVSERTDTPAADGDSLVEFALGDRRLLLSL